MLCRSSPTPALVWQRLLSMWPPSRHQIQIPVPWRLIRPSSSLPAHVCGSRRPGLVRRQCSFPCFPPTSPQAVSVMAPLRPLGAVAALLRLLLLATLHPGVASAQDSLLINCYRWDGAVSPNNTRCPNSNACCGPKATCLSNRLCANPEDAPNLWVRGSCAVKGWDGACAQICKYSTPRSLVVLLSQSTLVDVPTSA